MRFARFEDQGAERLGFVDGDELRALPVDADLFELLALEPEARTRRVEREAAREATPLANVRLCAPIRPRSLRDFITFEEHIEGVLMGLGLEVSDVWHEIPTFYFTNPVAVVGSGDDVQIPPGCTMLDFELEVAAVVAREGSNLTEEQARCSIGGYTILNDWSARDLQIHEQRVGLGPAKGKDFASTLGPWIVTTDELEQYRRDDRLDLELEVWVNGDKIGDDTLANMAWSFEQMLVYASRGTKIVAGDVLGSGTCGSGCLAELWGRYGRVDPPPLKSGDLITMTVEGIGTIENSVVESGVEPVPVPRARPGRRRVRS